MPARLLHHWLSEGGGRVGLLAHHNWLSVAAEMLLRLTEGHWLTRYHCWHIISLNHWLLARHRLAHSWLRHLDLHPVARLLIWHHHAIRLCCVPTLWLLDHLLRLLHHHGHLNLLRRCLRRLISHLIWNHLLLRHKRNLRGCWCGLNLCQIQVKALDLMDVSAHTCTESQN